MVVFSAHARNMFFGARLATIPVAAGSSLSGSGSSSMNGLGSQAVIVFFVLSGYLVGGSVLRGMKDGRWAWGPYLRQRLVRLWIVLVPALVIGWVLDATGTRFFGAGSLYAGGPGQSVIAGPVIDRLGLSIYLGNVLFLQEITVPHLGSNSALWSLANEFWYYIAFPFLVLVFRGRGRLTRLASAAVLICIGCLVGKSIGLYFLIWLFGAGVSLVALKMNITVARLFTGFSVLAFLATVTFLRRHPIPQYTADVVLGLICAAALYGCLHDRGPARPILYPQLSGHLSNMSYTLYLVHLPALVFISAVVMRPWHPWTQTPISLAAFGCVIAAVFLYAVLLYLVFERHTGRVREAVKNFGKTRDSAGSRTQAGAA